MSRQVAIHVGAYDYEVPKDVADELARLRAEVERLKTEAWDWRKQAEVDSLQKQEALAQVAVLDQELARVIGLAKTQVDTENHPPQWSASEFLQLVHQAYRLGPKGFNEKARALLDRLQQAEAVAEAAYYILQHQTEGNWTRLRAVLAAWQEGAA